MGKKRTRQDTITLENLIKEPESAENLEQISNMLVVELANYCTNERIIEILHMAVANNRDDVFIYFGTRIPYNNIFVLLGVEPTTSTMLEEIYNRALTLNEKGRIHISPIIHEIPSDGNCMYNAVITGAYNKEITIENLRQQVFDVIESDLDRYVLQLESQFLELIRSGNPIFGFSDDVLAIINDIANIEESLRLPAIRERDLVRLYIDTIRQDGIWGGDVELGIISQVLNIQIEVNQAGGSIIIINNTGDDNAFLVNIDQNGNHYNLILGYELRETVRLPDGNLVYIEDYPLNSNHSEDSSNLKISGDVAPVDLSTMSDI